MRALFDHKNKTLIAATVANIMKTSLGPKGLDKILISPDGDITITNDGATILEKIHVEHQITGAFESVISIACIQMANKNEE